MKAAGFNAASIYFDWAYHSPAPGKYDFTGVRDVDQAARHCEIRGHLRHRAARSLHQRRGRRRRLPGLARHDARTRPVQRPDVPRGAPTSGCTGSTRSSPATNSPTARAPSSSTRSRTSSTTARDQARAYMKHLEDKAHADGITVPLTGNNNGTFNDGVGKLDIDGPDSYPQGFNCSNPTQWHGVPDISYDHPAGRPLYTPEFQGGVVRPVGRAGIRQVRAAASPDQIRERLLQAEHRRRRDGAELLHDLRRHVNWGWQADAEPGTTRSYDYGAAITRGAPARPEVRPGQADRLLHAERRAADQDRRARRRRRRPTPRSSTRRG